MQIELDKLEEHGGRFSRVYARDDLALDDSDFHLIDEVKVEGRTRRAGNEVELNGRLNTQVEAPCARCLKPVRWAIETEFSERFVPAVSWRSEELHELSQDDLDLAVFDGEAVNIDEVVREEILLAVPGHLLCSEECKGLCPVCGVDRNSNSCQCESKSSDSRWEILKELRLSR